MHLLECIGIVKMTEFTNVEDVELNYFHQIQNLIQVLDGQVFSNQKMMNELNM